MRNVLPIFFIMLAARAVWGQSPGGPREGKVSYTTTQSVYVKFGSTQGISAGDTLYTRQGGRYVPALLVRNTSSISCVCTPLLATEFHLSASVYARPRTMMEIRPGEKRSGKTSPGETSPGETLPGESPPEETRPVEPRAAKDTLSPKFKQELSGRLSISSYTNLFSEGNATDQRIRYTFSMHAGHLGNTGFSAESYVSFSHSNKNRESIKNNIFNGLKIYNLALRYDFSETMHVSAGRKVNPRLSSVGAIDGIQFENTFRKPSLTLGVIAGSRPDYEDYRVNPGLFQAGAYLSHGVAKPDLTMQNSLAILEQTNQGRTDRRFLYFQHTSWILKDLNLFASGEADLYRKVNDTARSIFNLSNAYLAMSYRILPGLSVGLSYTSRQNVIYYETYKDFVERLLETGALQGWRLRVHARPMKKLVLGLNAGYRYRKTDPLPSRHVYGFATWNGLPWLAASLTLSATWLETSYLQGNIYGLALSRELIPGRLSGDLKYRYVDYLYRKSEFPLVQHVCEASLSWTVVRKLYLSVFYEGTFETQASYNRLYVSITKRF